LTTEQQKNIDNFYKMTGITRKEWFYGWIC
jgi:hypothetical protein